MYATKMENLKETDIFQNRCHIPKLHQNQVNNLSRLITPNEVQAVIKVSQQKSPEPNRYRAEF